MCKMSVSSVVKQLIFIYLFVSLFVYSDSDRKVT